MDPTTAATDPPLPSAVWDMSIPKIMIGVPLPTTGSSLGGS
jgi:hypothetical protein